MVICSMTVVAQGQGQETAQFHNLQLSTIIEGKQLTYNLYNNSEQQLQVQYEIWNVKDWLANNNAPKRKHLYALFQLNNTPKPKPNVQLFRGAIHQDNVWWRVKPLKRGAIHQDNVWWRILNNTMDEKPLHSGVIQLPSSATVPIHLQENLQDQAIYLLVLRVIK